MNSRDPSTSYDSLARISLVVPVYSGAPYLEALVEQVEALRARLKEMEIPAAVAELILVDDEAIDESGILVESLSVKHDWVVALHMSRNYGQHAATIAGILHTSGDWIVTLDEDLQHSPLEIESLLRKAVLEHADVVYAKPTGDVHGSLIRDYASRLFKRILSILSGDENSRNYNSFRLIRGPVARAAASVCGHSTYFDVGLSWFTQRVCSKDVEMQDQRFRDTGRSGYRFPTLVSHALKMLLSTHLKILHGAALLGLMLTGVTAIAALWLIAVKLLFPESIAVVGWTSTIVIISFFGGITIFMLGVVLQYLSILVLRAHGKPTFFLIDRSTDAALEGFFRRTDT